MLATIQTIQWSGALQYKHCSKLSTSSFTIRSQYSKTILKKQKTKNKNCRNSKTCKNIVTHQFFYRLQFQISTEKENHVKKNPRTLARDPLKVQKLLLKYREKKTKTPNF